LSKHRQVFAKSSNIEMAENSLTAERLPVISGVDASCVRSAVRSCRSYPVSKHTVLKVSEAGTAHNTEGQKKPLKAIFCDLSVV
jgi:hypothetical protein